MHMNLIKKSIAAAGFVGVVATGSAQAEDRPPLGEVKEITDGIMTVGIANIVRRKCPSISGRMVKGFFYVNSLKSKARELGYSNDEINAFLDNKEEEKKIIARGTAILESRGVRDGDPESFCAYGREEIAKSSAIGSFLRAN